MNPDDYMQEGIRLAHESEARGGVAIGAVVVDANGEVIGRGMSLAGVIHDVTNHAETAAIRAACEHLETIDLAGCTLYGTLEPCNMCLSAALWANMQAVYFGAYATDVPANPYEFKNYSSEQRVTDSQRWDGKPLSITGGIMQDPCKQLLKSYRNWQKAEA